MQDCYFILIFFIIIYYGEELLVHGQSRELEMPFNVNENQAEVEQLVYQYTKKKFSNSFLKEIRFWTGQTDPSTEIISVCDLQFLTLLAMCKAILDMYYFGFTFNYELPGNTCQPEIISFKQPPCDGNRIKCWGNKDKPRMANLFLCPRLKFNDLETDKTIIVPFNHYISGSHLPKSYFSYIEEDGAIYPQKYAYNVNFEKIVSVIEDKYRGDIIYATNNSMLESIFMAMKNMKNLSTYEKFFKTFKCRNVCGLNRASKISLCREIIRKEESESKQIYSEGYDETVCLTRRVFYAEGRNDPASREFSMAILKCPPLYILEEGRNIFSSSVKYLSMGLESRSFMWYTRRNVKGREIRLEAAAYKTRFDIFEEDERRQREYMEPGYVVNLVKSTIGEPALPLSILSPENGPSRVLIHKHIVEDSAIDLMKVVRMTQPYKRFSITYGIESIFGMEVDAFSKMCYIILKSNQLHFSFTSTESDFPCKLEDNNIRLVMRDAESLPGDKLWVRQCPPVNELLFKHYITISTRKNVVLIYEKYRLDNYVIPVAFARGFMNRIDIVRS